MIKIGEGGLRDVWPEKDSPEIKALSKALQEMTGLIKHYSDASQIWSGVDDLPENVLDYLAVENRSMYYDQSADIDTKRKIIAQTLMWYTHAGTPAAVKEMLKAIFGEADLVEWFDYTEPPCTPGTFDIITSARMTAGIMDELTEMIRKVKNTRSHVRRVVAVRDIHAAACAAIYQVAVQECTCSNDLSGSTPSQSGLAFGAIVSSNSESIAVNTLNGSADAAGSEATATLANATPQSTAINAGSEKSGAPSGEVSAQTGRVTSTDTYIKEE